MIVNAHHNCLSSQQLYYGNLVSSSQTFMWTRPHLKQQKQVIGLSFSFSSPNPREVVILSNLFNFFKNHFGHKTGGWWTCRNYNRLSFIFLSIYSKTNNYTIDNIWPITLSFVRFSVFNSYYANKSILIKIRHMW